MLKVNYFFIEKNVMNTRKSVAKINLSPKKHLNLSIFIHYYNSKDGDLF